MERPAVPYERALAIVVLEAEPLVAAFRSRHDPSARSGMPAHVTINFPFVPDRELSDEVLQAVAKVCARTPSFAFQLTEIRRFPSVVYLAPEPRSPFEALITAVAHRFPDSPPYGGRFQDIVPHLTVAQIEDSAALAAVARDFELAARERLPIAGRATAATLFHNPEGRWEARAVFALAPAAPRAESVSAGRRM